MSVNFIPFVFPGVKNVRCAFQTRTGGFSQNRDNMPFAGDQGFFAGGNISFAVGDHPEHVQANREDLRRTLGLDTLMDTKQVHGVTTIFEPDPSTAALHDEPSVKADGMSTSRPGMGLMVKSADCQPILIAHESGRFVAGLHAGWQGNRQNYPGVAVGELCKYYQVEPRSLFAVRGPSLGPSAAEFIHFDTEWGPDFARWYAERERTVNLWMLAKDQLLAAGLLPERLFSLDLCTFSLGLFYSFRRNKITGRQGSVIWIQA